MLPGMERRLTEHMMVHHSAASEDGGRSLQEVPLLKGSFGHHSALGNSSSQESLYGNQPQQAHLMPTSDSLHSLRGGHTLRGGASIPIMAEIVPVNRRQSSQFEAVEVLDHNGLVTSASSGGITSSSFMPASSSTLPRSLENGYMATRLQSVNSRLTTSPVLVDTHMRPSSTMAMAMATMPRKMSNGAAASSSQPLPLVTKKKSVTIGTFTTVVEPYDNEDLEDESLITSAV